MHRDKSSQLSPQVMSTPLSEGTPPPPTDTNMAFQQSTPMPVDLEADMKYVSQHTPAELHKEDEVHQEEPKQKEDEVHQEEPSQKEESEEEESNSENSFVEVDASVNTGIFEVCVCTREIRTALLFIIYYIIYIIYIIYYIVLHYITLHFTLF